MRMVGTAVFGALVLAPAAAQGATRDVQMGLNQKNGAPFFKLLADVNAYFPSASTIHVGDRLRFVPAGFHDAELPAKGQKPHGLLAPTGQKVSGANDAAGRPFWFNGLDMIGFNPAIAVNNFGKKFRYNGRKSVMTGLPLGARLKPMTVTFPKAGSYTFYCNIHAGMKGTVKVVAKRKRIPSNKAHKAKAAKEVARDLKNAQTLSKTTVPDGEISVGVKGRNGTELLDFLPRERTVAVGASITFKIPDRLMDVHTATAGPGDPAKEPDSYLGKLTKSFEQPVFDPIAVYPSEPPGYTPQTLTPQSHGNGFWNTGVMDAVGESSPLQSGTVTFPQAGTYTFYCLIHPFMKATVTAK